MSEEMRLKSEVAELRSEISTLRDLIDGGDLPAGVNRLAGKIERQRKALDALHTRVYNQRFHLRLINGLGRGLTKEEYEAAKSLDSEQNQKRLVGVISD